MQQIKINQCLSLSETNFSDKNYNIDYLASQLYLDISSQEKLLLATRCVVLCEKFHSYFHFEQSYFHLLLAKRCSDSQERLTQLELAIVQDPLNHEAKSLLSNEQSEDAKDYTRDFKSFADFLMFAAGKTATAGSWPSESYWYYFDEYQQTNKLELLIKTVETITSAHKSYHTEAAKIYYNRHLIFAEMGNDILAQNDLIKSRNLDPSVAEANKCDAPAFSKLL